MNTIEEKLKKLFNSTLFLKLLVVVLVIGIFFLSFRIYFANKVIDAYNQKTNSAYLFIIKNYELTQIENAFQKIVLGKKNISQEEFLKNGELVLKLPILLLELNNLDVTMNESINPFLNGYGIVPNISIKPLTEEEQIRIIEIIELWENLYYYNRYITFQGITESERQIAEIVLRQIDRLKEQLSVIQNIDSYHHDLLSTQKKLFSIKTQEIIVELNNTLRPYRDIDPYENSPYLNNYIEEE